MPNNETSFLEKAGAVLGAVVKHVPGRGVLWGFIGFFVGLVMVGLSFGIGLLVMDRGAMILGYLIAIPIAIPFLGGALFAMHGVHRGAARAALEIEQKFGLVSYVVNRVLSIIEKSFGERLATLPLEQIETGVKGAIDQYLRSSDIDEGSGIAGYVVRRAKRTIARKLETYLLAAYRAEGGGVSMEKISARVTKEVSERMGGVIMSPLNKQLFVFMTLYVLVAGGWWFWLFMLMSVFTRA